MFLLLPVILLSYCKLLLLVQHISAAAIATDSTIGITSNEATASTVTAVYAVIAGGVIITADK